MVIKNLAGSCLKTHSILGWRASGLFLAAAVSLCAQGIPHDWTHDHVVFSKPDGASDQVKSDPRLAIQTLSKTKGKDKVKNNDKQNNGQGNGQGNNNDAQDNALPPITGLSPNSQAHKPPPPPGTPTGDWSYFLGNTSVAGMAPAAYPATVVGSFTTQSCSDIAMFTINKAGGTNQPSIVAFKDLYTLGAVAATSLGNFTANNISTGQSLTVNGQTITASGPVAATQTGTFTGPPVTGSSINIVSVNPANTLTLTTNATPQTAVGTFTAQPTSTTAPTITVTSGSNTLSLTTNATGGTQTGSFTGTVGTTGALTLHSASAPANTLSLTSSGIAQTATGTFTSAPSSATAPTITITNGINSNVLSLTTNATVGSVVGTFTANVRNTGAATITNTSNPASNTLTLTPNPTAAKATGTFTAQSTTGSVIVTVVSGTTNTITLTPTQPTKATGTVTFTGTPGNETLVTINGNAYAFDVTLDNGGGSGHCGHGAASGNPCVLKGDTTTHSAQNLQAAINNNSTQCGNLQSGICFFNVSAANTNVSATQSGAVTTLTALTAGPAGNSITLAGDDATHFTVSGATLTGGSNGANACSGSAPTFTGTFGVGSTTTIEASDVVTAIGLCTTPGITASSSTNVVTFTATTFGSDITVSDSTSTANGFGTFTSTAGTDGTNTCTSATTGTFAIDNNTTTEASNLAAAITACQTNGFLATVGVTATSSTNTVTVTETKPGAFLSDGNTLTGFSWGSISGNSAGSPTCPSTTTATFATSGNLTTLATNVATAINACNTAPSGTGFTAASGVGTVAITATENGAFGSSVSGTNLAGIFSWGAGMSTGTNGANSCPSVSTTGTYIGGTDTTTEATNLTAAINACKTSFAAVGFTATSSTNTVTVTATALGNIAGYSLTNATTGFAWTGSFSAGSNGSSTCSSSTTGTFSVNTGAGSPTTTTVAGGLASAITSCNTSFPAVGVAAATSTNTVTVTERTPGTSSTIAFSVGATNNAGIFTWAAPSAGSNGSNACGPSTTGTFATDSSTTTLAANLAAAINACPTAAGVTASSSTATVTITARIAGTGGNNITTTITSTPGFSWSTGALAGGSNGSTASGNFPYWSVNAPATAAQVAANLATAIGVTAGTNATATVSGTTITISATTAGTGGNSIALGTPTFTGFTWASSTLIGGSAAGTCNGGAGPTVAWAYRGTATPVTTSPVLSPNGNMVAYVEQGAPAVLHVLKFANGDGSQTAGTYTTVNPTVAANIAACGTSCVVNLSYGGKNTNSSPFYSYAEDAIYVGDDAGVLYRIAPVFNGGSTAPSVTWSTTVNATFGLKSPVLDFNLQRVVVADTGGRVSTVSITGAHSVVGTITTIGANPVTGPILDISLGKMMVFAANDAGSTGANKATVVQAATADLTSVVRAEIGSGLVTGVVNLGQLDNNYFTAPDPSTGALYACGNPNVAATLYRIGFNSSGVMSSTVATGPALSTATPSNCSPMSEVFNSGVSPGTDWLFAGVSVNCGFGGSATGCVDSFNITGWQASTNYAVGQLILDSNMNIQKVTAISGTGTSGSSPPSWNTTQLVTTTDNAGANQVTWTMMGLLLPSGTFAENAGTSGIVIDDIGTGPHNSNLYFTTLGAAMCATQAGGGNLSTCAVNLTQAGLH